MPKVRWGALFLLIGAVFYSSFITEAALGYPINPTRSYLSELAARGQATSTLFRSTDAIAGVCFLIAGILLMRFWQSAVQDRSNSTDANDVGGAGRSEHTRRTACIPGQPTCPSNESEHTPGQTGRSKISTAVDQLRRWPLVPIGLIIAGVSTVFDAAFPLDCAESLGQCAARVQAGEVSISHHLHAVTSGLAGTGLIVVVVGVLVSVAFQKMTAARILAATSFLLLIVQVGEMALKLPVGITQRLHVVSVVAMFIALAVGVLRRDPDELARSARAPELPDHAQADQ